MNKQDRNSFLTVVSNDAIDERIIGMSFGEKREAWADWDAYASLYRLFKSSHRTFREWLFDRVEQQILAERDANYNEAGEPL